MSGSAYVWCFKLDLYQLDCPCCHLVIHYVTALVHGSRGMRLGDHILNEKC